MISYAPLWETMKKKKATTYTLRQQNVSSSTVRRLKANQSVSSNTFDLLCKILNCKLSDVAIYIADE